MFFHMTLLLDPRLREKFIQCKDCGIYVIFSNLTTFDWEKVKRVLKEEISANITWTSMALSKRELEISKINKEVPNAKKNHFTNLHGIT